MLWFFHLFVLTNSFAYSHLNILINVALSSKSHVKGFFAIANEMKEHGHTIHFASSKLYFPYMQGYNFTYHEFEDIPFDDMHKLFQMTSGIQGYSRGDRQLQIGTELYEAAYHDYKITFPSITKLLKAQQFDLVICDFYSVGCRDATELQGVPMVISLQSTFAFELFDISYMSRNYDFGKTSRENMSFFQRLKEVFRGQPELFQMNKAHLFNLNRARRELGIATTSAPLQPLNRNLVLSTSFTGFEPAFHLPPNVKMIGPIKSTQFEALSEELQFFLDSHKKVIYLGFGALTALLSADIQDIFGALSELLERQVIDGIIWGLGFTNFNITHPDIKLMTWAPQYSILQHSSTKLFLSHCGLESVFEAIDNLIPLLCNPMFGDQTVNSVKVMEAGIGLHLPRRASSSSLIVNYVETLLVDSEYRFKVNLLRLKTISDFRSKHAIQDAQHILEEYAYLAKTCRPYQSLSSSALPCEISHLIPSSERMSYIQSHLLDVYAFLLFTPFVLSFLAFYLIRFLLFKTLLRQPKTKCD